jgi:hypothetical protein
MASLASMTSDMVRNITISAKTDGVDQATGQLRLLQGGLSGVAGVSDQTTRSTLSVDAAFTKLRTSIDAEYRSAVKMADAEKTLNAARAQGLVTLAEQNDLLALAATRYKVAADSSAGLFASLGGIRTGLSGITTLLSGFGMVALLGELMKIPTAIENIVHETAGLGHMADVIGITTKQLQELDYAANLVHVSTDTMDSAMERFSKNLGLAASGTGQLNKWLTANHVAISGDFTKDFTSVIALMENATNAEQRSALSTAAFGKTAQEMGQLTAAGIRQATDEYDRMGPISDENIKKMGEVDKVFIAVATEIETKFTKAVVAAVSAIDDLNNVLPEGLLKKLAILTELSFNPAFAATYLASQFTGSAGVAPVDTGGPGSSFAKNVVASASSTISPPTPEQIAALKAAADAQKALQKSFDDAMTSADKHTASLRTQAAALGMSTEAAATYTKQQDLINFSEEKGIALTPEVMDKINQEADAYGKATDNLKKMQEEYQQLQDVAKTVTDNMQKAFDDFVDNGKFKFKDMVDSMLKDLAKLEFQQTVTGPLTKGLTSGLASLFGFGTATSAAGWATTVTAGARGMVLDHSNVIPFGQGGIVNRPTLFPMANGATAQIGEAGAEGVLPLRKTPSGKLGVESSGGGGTVNAPITISVNAAGADPAAVARLTVALSQLQANLSTSIVKTVQDARSRRII